MQLRALAFPAALLLASCAARTEPPEAPPASSALQVAPEARRAFFGELHIHTSYSFDAWGLIGTKTTPEDAYRFGRGEAIDYMGHRIQRAWPLDFMAVTDHAENMGLLNELDDPNSALARSELGREILQDKRKSFFMVADHRFSPQGIPGLDPARIFKSAWAKQVDAANRNYRPGQFTTFAAYEWSQMANERDNLHRNVIFAGDNPPLPFTSNDSGRPEDLWTYLEANRRLGVQSLAIPHNANASNGLMYDWNMSDGRPIDEAYAQRRALNEPLAEIAQQKGQSETLPALSQTDEFANFEVFDVLITQRDQKSKPDGSYIRQAYGRGLTVEKRVGANPFKFGVVGGSDFHNGVSASDENAYAGNPGGIDPRVNVPDADEAKRQLGIVQVRSSVDREATRTGRTPAIANRLINAGGAITGVWAETNTREAIFAALKRKETFATSGSRIRLRFFGGWRFAGPLLSSPDWARTAYRLGVPMGGDLPARGASQAPSFIVQALKDPDGANLDRIQIIKVWLEGDVHREKIFNVALSDGRRPDPATGKARPVGSTVDLRDATYKNTIGAASLQTVWRDPEFDPSKPAVYYVRVLQIPTPRWTTYLAVARNLPVPEGGPAVIQERAWSSPIWYSPAPQARARGGA